MRIVVDENIPYAVEAFGALGSVRCFAGRDLSADAVRDADVLLVRSVTRVDADLLRGSQVRFVGSATIGTDHIDLDYLRSQGIGFAHAPGSNADSVVEYIMAALLGLAAARGEGLRGKVIGIIGCGNIGGRLAVRLPALGLRVLKNDPPLAARAEADGKPHDFVSLDAVLKKSDIITLHVPLTKQGRHATHHLINDTTLCSLNPASWLLNSSRGAVVSNEALKGALRDHQRIHGQDAVGDPAARSAGRGGGTGCVGKRADTRRGVTRADGPRYAAHCGLLFRWQGAGHRNAVRGAVQISWHRANLEPRGRACAGARRRLATRST